MADNDIQTINVNFDGKSLEAKVEIDSAGEYVVTADNGRFLKFPTGTNLRDAVKQHNDANPVE